MLLNATSATAQQAQSPATGPTAATSSLRAKVTYDPAICDSYTGRVYLMFGQRGEPRHGPNWFNTQPFFAVDVTNWKPDSPLTFDDSALAYPAPLCELPAKQWSVQAVMRRNLDSPTIGSAAGDAFSAVAQRELSGNDAQTIELRIDQLASEQPFVETDRIKLVEIVSPLLSKFYGREIRTRAAVILPINYDAEPQRRYPSLYFIHGFGGDHHSAPQMAGLLDMSGAGDDICFIVPDPLCFTGHHVFADSATNGSRGQSLINELIPEIEKRFRLVASPDARFLTGASSGGWSSLWLQVEYPEFFGGVWSLAPDPVDFTNFQYIKLYNPGENMFVDSNGDRRPVMRMTHDGRERVMIWYDDFAKMELVVGDGGQLGSFEAVFSPRGDDGRPMALFDRTSGAVNTAVAESWKPYDIRLKLEKEWPEIGPMLAGKLRVYCGNEDNFYLEGAVRELKSAMAALESDAVIEILPGKNHMNILDPPMMERLADEVIEAFAASHPEYAPAMAP